MIAEAIIRIRERLRRTSNASLAINGLVKSAVTIQQKGINQIAHSIGEIRNE